MKEKNKPVIKEIVPIGDIYGKTKLLCLMDDDSKWQCNPDGTNWERNQLSKEELQKSFNKFLNENKTI